MDKTTFSTQTIIALIIGLVLGFALGAYTYRDQGTGDIEIDETDTATTTTRTGAVSSPTAGSVRTSTTTANRLAIAPGEFDVANQPAGASVRVTDINVDRITWVAVRDYQNGNLGNVLGARRIPAGTQREVAVDLLRATAAGRTYAVVLYADNGDLSFNSKTDTLVTSAGKPVAATFVAQ